MMYVTSLCHSLIGHVFSPYICEHVDNQGMGRYVKIALLIEQSILHKKKVTHPSVVANNNDQFSN